MENNITVLQQICIRGMSVEASVGEIGVVLLTGVKRENKGIKLRKEDIIQKSEKRIIKDRKYKRKT